MERLAYVSFLAAMLASAVGCSRTSLTYVPDGGTVCSGYDTAGSCNSDSRCEWWVGCCGGSPECVLKGTPLPSCATCTSCSGLDEATCNADPACTPQYQCTCSCNPQYLGCVPAGHGTACGIECPAMHCQCDGLDEQQCIADQTSLGCTANYCAGCNGTTLFSGCTGPGEGAPPCPDLFCPNGCRTQSDCANSGGECLAPGQPLCGGACPMSCSSDAQCGAGSVCSYSPCSCSGSNSNICQPSCATAGCPNGQTCGNDGHCSATSCTTKAQCPPYFDCVIPPGTGTSHCERLACTADGDCGSGGYCVDGACYDALGSCRLPPP